METFKFEEPTIERKEEAIDYIREHYEYSSPINGSGGLDRYIDNYEESNHTYKKVGYEDRGYLVNFKVRGN